MYERKILNHLRNWAKSVDRKPLVLRGARQVGKTTVIHMFGREYSNFIILNLDEPGDKEIFAKPLPVQDLMQLIYITKNVNLKPGPVLLFIDEIQNSPVAVAAMRYFYESLPNIHLIAAGSLLEIMMETKEISFPVGRVEYRFLHPFSFEEFLIALGNNAALESYNKIPSDDYTTPALMKLFHNYTMIGGMPEVVSKYLATNDISEIRKIYQSLMISFQDDVAKYARSKTGELLRFVIEVVPLEAGRRIKLAGFGNSNYGSREMGECLRTLERAMILKLFYPATSTEKPILPNRKKSPKLQFLDTGIINHLAGLQAHYIKGENLQSFYQGKIAEHIVCQELIANREVEEPEFTFWVREEKHSSAEVDFVIQYNENIIPTEVKSGKTGKLRSLHQFMDRSNYNYAIRLHEGKLGIEKIKTPNGKVFNLLNLPYCYAGKIKEYIKWFMNKS